MGETEVQVGVVLQGWVVLEGRRWWFWDGLTGVKPGGVIRVREWAVYYFGLRILEWTGSGNGLVWIWICIIWFCSEITQGPFLPISEIEGCFCNFPKVIKMDHICHV